MDAVGMEYIYGVHMLMLRSVFSTFDIDLGIFYSIHTPSKLCLNSVRKTVCTECVLSASCVRTCVFRRIVINVFLVYEISLAAVL